VLKDGEVLNDATLPAARRHGGRVRARRRRRHRAVGHDGRPHRVPRARLDEQGGSGVPILSYAAKFASAF
jgi:delta-aminolevulinic acid dehydratase/porphobilinogen synthase